MAGRSVPVSVTFLGNTADLEASLVRAGIVAEDTSQKIRGSAAAAGRAAAEQARLMGASADEQEAAAGKAAVAYTEASAKITRAQRAAGDAAASAARKVGASLDEQKAAYTRAIASTSEYEAAQKRAADASVMAASRAAKAQEDAAKKSKAANDSLSSFGGKVATAGIAAFGAAAFEGVKGAAQLQKSMEMLHTQAGATQGQVQQLTHGVLGMAGAVGTAPNQLADGMYHVVSSLNATLPAASRASTEMKVLRTASEGAKVGGADLTDVTNALDAAIVSGVKGVQNYHQAMGALNGIVGAGDMKMQDLADALSTGLLGPMKTYGLSLRDVGGALAVFGDNNIRGQEAATKLASAVRIMAAPSKAAGEALGAVGLSTLQMADDMRSGGLVKALSDLKQHLVDSGATASEQGLIIARAFGGRQSTGVQLLLQQLDRLKAKTEQVGQGAKTFNSDWQATTHTAAFQFDQLKATVASLADKFGLYLIPKLQAAGQAISSVIAWMQKHKAAAEALSVVIGGVLSVAVGAYAYTKAAAFVKATKDMAAGITSLATGVGSAATSIMTKLGLIGPAATSTEAAVTVADDGIVASADTTAAGVDAAIGSTGIGLILIGLGVAAEQLGTHWHSVMSGMKDAVNWMVQAAENALNGLIGTLNSVIHFFSGVQNAIGKVGVSPAFGSGNPFGMTNKQWAAVSPGLTGHGSHAMTSFMGHGMADYTNGLPMATSGPTWERIASTLASQGFSKIAIAGILGNFAQETGGGSLGGINTRDSGNGASGMGGMGIGQWTAGRYTAEKQYAAGLHLAPTSLEAQVGYLLKELRGSYHGAYTAISGASSPGQAAALFNQKFEGGTDPGGVRERAAQQAYGMLGGIMSRGGGGGMPKMPTLPSLRAYLNKQTGATKTRARAIHTLEYANPLAGDTYNVERTDQGKDFGDIHGNLGAIGNGVITLAQSLQGFGQTIVEKLTSGPNKGREVYYGLETGATGVGLHSGEAVRAGQAVARGLGTGGVELGFWNPATGRPLDNQGFNGSSATPGGTAFADWLRQIGNRGIFTTTSGGRTTGGGSNTGLTLAQLAQAYMKSLTTQGTSLLGRYQGATRTGSVSGLGGLLGTTRDTGLYTARAVAHNIAGSVAEKKFEETLASLLSVHTQAMTSLADRLVIIHQRAMDAFLVAEDKVLAKPVASLMTRLENAVQNGTVRTLESQTALGVSTQGMGPELMRMINRLGNSASTGQIGSALQGALTRTAPMSDAQYNAATSIVRAETNTSIGQVRRTRGLSRDARSDAISRLRSSERQGLDQLQDTRHGNVQRGQGSFNKLIDALRDTHQAGMIKLAHQLAIVHEAALQTLGQELYALQQTKDGDMLTLQATELKDQTQLAADQAADVLNIQKAQSTQQTDSMASQVTASKDQEQLVSDQATAQTQYVKDMSQTAQDQFTAMTTAVKDKTTLMADQSSGAVTAIGDTAQTQADTYGERGKFGLDLVAQQLQVQLDVLKAGFDQQINVAQQQLDALQAQADAAESAATIQVDQVTTAEDQLVALAQQNMDTVTIAQDAQVAKAQAHLDAITISQDQRIATAQAHVDSVTLAQDIKVQLAQTAVDLSATAPKAQQDVTNAQLKYAQGAQSKAVAQAQAALSSVTSGANSLIQQASSAYAAAQGQATLAIQQASVAYQRAQDTASASIEGAQANLQSITSTYNLALAQAQQGLQGVQDTAAQQEAVLQGKITTTQAQAQTQFSGSGLQVFITGVNLHDPNALASEIGWAMRTQLPA